MKGWARIFFNVLPCLLLLVSGTSASSHAHHSPPMVHHPSPHPSPSPSPPPPITVSEVVANVTLVDLTLFDEHSGWLDTSMEIYFKCEKEDRKTLKNVKNVKEEYVFHNEDAFQPLTTLSATECKKCGLFEKDVWSSDDVYAEWIFCATNFTASPTLRITVEKQFNATFSCLNCLKEKKISFSRLGGGSTWAGVFFILLVAAAFLLVSTAVLVLVYIAHKRYEIKAKAKREETTKFMMLSDDEEDDLEGNFKDEHL